jgi:hypothetical protein
MTSNDTQVFITGVLYNSNAYPNDPFTVFNIVDRAFRQITTLDYFVLAVNRAENRFSTGTTREQLLIFMQTVKYNGNDYLTSTDAANLRTDLLTSLNSISEIQYEDVQVRTRKTIT